MLCVFLDFLFLLLPANVFFESRPTSPLALKFSRIIKLWRGKDTPLTAGAVLRVHFSATPSLWLHFIFKFFNPSFVLKCTISPLF